MRRRTGIAGYCRRELRFPRTGLGQLVLRARGGSRDRAFSWSAAQSSGRFPCLSFQRLFSQATLPTTAAATLAATFSQLSGNTLNAAAIETTARPLPASICTVSVLGSRERSGRRRSSRWLSGASHFAASLLAGLSRVSGGVCSGFDCWGLSCSGVWLWSLALGLACLAAYSASATSTFC